MTIKRKIIDAHIHWWDIENNYYPWLCDKQGDRDAVYGENALAKNYLPVDYKKEAQNYDVVGAVHIQAEWDHKDDIGETQWLDKIAQSPDMQDFPFAIVAFANLADPEVESLLKQHKQYPNVRGIRHMLNYMASDPTYCWADEDFLSNALWLNNYSLLAQYDLSFDLMCFARQMPAIAELAEKHPNTNIILEHCGMPIEGESSMQEWREGISLLAKQPNVFCKLGGLGTMIPKWDLAIAKPIFDHILVEFGIQRLMFATNFPTDSLFCDFNYAVSQFEALTSVLSEADQQEFFVNNARKIYQF